MCAPAPSPIPGNMPCAAASSTSIRRAASRSASISSATRWNRSGPSIPTRSGPRRGSSRSQLLPMSEMALTPEVRQRLPPALCRAVRSRHRRRPALRVRSRRGASIRAWSIGCRCSTNGSRTLFDYLPGAAVTLDPLARRCARAGGSSRSPTITTRARRRSSARPSARRLIIPCRPTACS